MDNAKKILLHSYHVGNGANLDVGPDVLNHNIETVPDFYPEVRPQAEYERSLDRKALKRIDTPWST